jgi:hypothetical protein
MKSTHSLLLVFVVTWLFAAPLSMSADALPPGKNWLGPTHKIYAQQLADQIMKQHPELISATFHGVPPGAAPNTYTMYAGSFPDRIGNIDDPDDVMVTEKGITILDPRWHKTKDAQRKYVVMTPLRDAAGENIGLLVLAYKNPSNSGRGDHYFLVASTALRDRLQAKIPNAAALFAPAKN